jgi:hypothetical protein
MLWILIAAGCVAGLVVAMVVVGLALPRDHVAARRATLARPPAEVWRALTDLDAYPRWRRGVTAVERLSPTEFRERSSHGVIRFEVVEDRPDELRIARIADPGLPFGGRWIYELAPSDGATRLTITEDGFITNPVFRFLSRTVFSTASTLENFLVDLGAHLGTPVAVEPAPPSKHIRSEALRAESAGTSR